ncbi:MAG: alkaline phosphatase family protein [Chloroflexota bacterium]|nr:alkaline phosphatase family protein [Chloroflexota bacterium]
MLVTDKFYRTKYRAVSQQLGLPEHDGEGTPRRGFVVVQIDALSHEHLLEAMERGYAPYLRKLCERGHRLAPYTCGLPSSTAACQSAIMFGNSHDVPAFRWYDKAARRTVSYKLPGNNHDLEREVSQGQTGILAPGGSSYSNLISGGASRSLFTMSTFGQGSLLDGIKGLGFFALFLLSPVRSLRVIGLSVSEFLYAFAERSASYWMDERRVRFEGAFPLVRVLAHVFVKEMQTFAVMVDMYRGVPNIYTTYNTYDNMAHHFGPTTRPAMRAVRTVDRQIRQLDRMRRHSATPYDLWILSDHGQTPAVPFRQLYGQSFGHYVSRLLDDLPLAEHAGAEEHTRSHVAFLADELRTAEQSLRPATARAVGRLRRYVEEAEYTAEKPGEWAGQDWPTPPSTLGPGPSVVVTGCSSTAGIYLNRIPGRADMTNIEALYPGLIDRLVEHPGVGLLIGREGRRVIVLGKHGRLILEGSGPPRIVGRDPVADLEKGDWTLPEIMRVACYPRSADLMVVGSVTNGVGVAFEEQMGVHGAFGGPQAYPFIMVPTDSEFDARTIRSAHDLYPVFRSYVDVEPPAAAVSEDYEVLPDKVDSNSLNLIP